MRTSICQNQRTRIDKIKMPEPLDVPQMALPPSDSNSSVEQRATSPAENTSNNSTTPPRDSTWLQVEACRDFRRDTCPRGDQCRFAHPEAKIIGKDGKVTCCYDFLKDRCRRDYCKYYHPPAHIKERLVSAGKQFGAVMSRAPLFSNSAVPGDACGLKPVGPVLSPYGPCPGGYPEKLPTCPDFVLGHCHAPVCSFVHPGPYVHHNVDQTVTVCRNFVKGLCFRGDKCRYYHLPPHYWFQQPIMAALPPNQGFPVGQPAMVPVYYPTPPSPVPLIPVCIQPPFLAVPPSPVSVALMPSVPVMPILSPVNSAVFPTVNSTSHFIPAQHVMVAPAPVSIIDSTAALNSSQGDEGDLSKAGMVS